MFWLMSKIYLMFRKELYKLFWISLGAVPGALIRWQLNNNFAVNIIGAILLGCLVGLPFKRRLQLILGIGFCGSLTTFSGWIYDFVTLLINGSLLQAFGSIIYMLVGGLLAVTFGFFVSRN